MGVGCLGGFGLDAQPTDAGVDCETSRWEVGASATGGAVGESTASGPPVSGDSAAGGVAGASAAGGVIEVEVLAVLRSRSVTALVRWLSHQIPAMSSARPSTMKAIARVLDRSARLTGLGL